MTNLRSLPTWMLKTLLRFSATRKYWMAALTELHARAIDEVIAETASADDSAAYPVAPPRGMH